MRTIKLEELKADRDKLYSSFSKLIYEFENKYPEFACDIKIETTFYEPKSGIKTMTSKTLDLNIWLV